MQAPGFVRLLADPQFRLYFFARCISTAGSMFTWVALPILVYGLTGSSLWTAAVASAQAAPYLVFGLLAGSLADRRDRRRLMVAADVGSALALATVVAAAWFDSLHPAHILAASLVVQTLFVFFDAANFGAVPALVGRDHLLVANSGLLAVTSLVEITVPALAAVLLLTLAPATLLMLDVGSFLASAALLAAIRRPLRRGAITAGALTVAGLVSDATAALRFVRRTRPVAVTTAVNACLSCVNGAFAGQIVVWADRRLGVHEGDILLGGLFVSWAVGGLLGAVLTPWLGRRLAPLALVKVLSGVVLATGAGMALTTSVAAALLLGVGWSAASMAALITGVSLRQAVSPENMMSTVNTAARMLALGIGFPAGALLAGAVAAVSGPAAGMAAGLVPLLAAFWLLRDPAVSPARVA